jgi:hypothetical protein
VRGLEDDYALQGKLRARWEIPEQNMDVEYGFS